MPRSIDGSIHYHRNINLGIAVALEWGLIVPVIRQAEERSFLGLARAIADLAARARTQEADARRGLGLHLHADQLRQSSAGSSALPIINQPESAILAIGGLRRSRWCSPTPRATTRIAIRSVQYFCLGFDHRTIDGADAGKFMREFKKILEGWDRKIG